MSLHEVGLGGLVVCIVILAIIAAGGGLMSLHTISLAVVVTIGVVVIVGYTVLWWMAYRGE